MLIDSHAHVQVRQFNSDRPEVIAAAFAEGIGRMIVPGIEVESSREAVALAAAYPGRIFAGVGTHPHDADTLTPDALAAQRELAGSPGVVAIGEIGLDYYRNLSPQDTQRGALISQFALARELDLPVILHNRDSHADMIAHLRQHGAGLRGVFHCFIGDKSMARDALDLGFYLSFAGPVAFPRNTELAEVAAWAPLDRILVETDSPYLAPPPFRGKRNEPRHVALVAARIAEARGLTLDALADATTRNATALFRLPPLDPQEDTSFHAPV
ncbi:MAG: putative metal-dependent hydrolase YcfH [Ktedonobacterales bacterium]|nr:MAG: putative metal-dependent hydrolase YcfH [Ktedonobacterales bacterium]